jgi:uncharacterized membrane protein
LSRPRNPDRFLTPEEKRAVEEAVAAAEKRTSAEIKVVLIRHCFDDITRKAARLFHKLGLDKTRRRNCVLILLVTANREFLIHGDEGIHKKVGQDFWNDVRDRMGADFAEGRFAEGLAGAVTDVGEKLAAFFPWDESDTDEIPDEVVRED